MKRFAISSAAVMALLLSAGATIAAGGASVNETGYFTGTGWATPPQLGIGERYTGRAPTAFNYSTHMTDYQGGVSSAYGDVVNGTYVPNAYVPDVVFGAVQPAGNVRASVPFSIPYVAAV